MKVFESMKTLKRYGPWYSDLGICQNINFDSEEDARTTWGKNFLECFRDWPEYSGNTGYPVPSFTAGVGPITAFNETPDHHMWNPDHPYGAARLRLLDHCIKWFKERNL